MSDNNSKNKNFCQMGLSKLFFYSNRHFHKPLIWRVVRARNDRGNRDKKARPENRAGFFQTMLSERELAAVDRFITQHLLDAQQLVVLADAVSAAERTGLDLTGVDRHRDIGNGRVFSLA